MQINCKYMRLSIHDSGKNDLVYFVIQMILNMLLKYVESFVPAILCIIAFYQLDCFQPIFMN